MTESSAPTTGLPPAAVDPDVADQEDRKWTPAKIIIWAIIALVGGIAWAILAISRGESINAIWFVFAAVCTYLIAYRFYSRFIAYRVLGVDDFATHRLPLDAAPDAYRMFQEKQDGCVKVVLKPFTVDDLELAVTNALALPELAVRSEVAKDGEGLSKFVTVEVQGAATNDGANVVQYDDWGGNNQQWQLVRVDGGAGSAPDGAQDLQLCRAEPDPPPDQLQLLTGPESRQVHVGAEPARVHVRLPCSP